MIERIVYRGLGLEERMQMKCFYKNPINRTTCDATSEKSDVWSVKDL